MASPAATKESNVDTAGGSQVKDQPLPGKRKQDRVPKKMNKSVREKVKRDKLNELFVELDQVRESDRQNNSKASILGDTTRALKGLLAQVESLRKENAALLSETHYITLERNELKDENGALQSEISDLRNALQGRMQADLVWDNSMDAHHHSLLQIQTNTGAFPVQHQSHILEPVNLNYRNPVQELQLFPASSTSPGPPSS